MMTRSIASIQSSVAIQVRSLLFMVVHETVGVADSVISFVDVLKGVQETKPVLVGLELRLSLIASG
jgi:hypothetical protein